MIKTLVFVVALALIPGCGVKRVYSGPAKHRDEIAILKGAVGGAIIVNIDNAGKRPDLVFRSRYELLPGAHEIEVRFNREPLMSSEVPCFVKFNAEPGKLYQVIGEFVRGKGWRAFLRKYNGNWSRKEMKLPPRAGEDTPCVFTGKI